MKKKIQTLIIIFCVGAVLGTVVFAHYLWNKGKADNPVCEHSLMAVYVYETDKTCLYEDGKRISEEIPGCFGVVFLDNESDIMVLSNTDANRFARWDVQYYFYHNKTLTGPIETDKNESNAALSGNGRYLACVKQGKFTVFDGYTGESRILDDSMEVGFPLEAKKKVTISQNGEAVYVQWPAKNMGYLYYDGEKKQVEQARDVFLMNDGGYIEMQFPSLKFYYSDGKVREVVDGTFSGECGRTWYINALSSQIIFDTVTRSGRNSEEQITTYFYENGRKKILLEGERLYYLGKTDWNMEGCYKNGTQVSFASKTVSIQEDLKGSCFIDKDFHLYYLQPNGKLKKISSEEVSDFTQPPNHPWLYVVENDTLMVYNKKTGSKTCLQGDFDCVKMVESYLDKGVLICAKKSDENILYYCEDGKKLQEMLHVQGGISSVIVSGKHIFAQVYYSDYMGQGQRRRCLFMGNPEDGFSLVGDNLFFYGVKYDTDMGFHVERRK